MKTEQPPAPLSYFLHANGPASLPTMHLGWGVTALSVAVVLIVVVLLAGALLRRHAKTDLRTIGPERGGMMFVTACVGLSTAALLVVLTYTLLTLWASNQPIRAPSLTITVTAYDWWWRIDYAGDGASAARIVTANEIHIPVGVPVRIDLKSADVIHAFWVPLLAGKTQAIPGQTNSQWIQADAPGVYRGQCAMFCGAQHAHMGFEVVAQPQAQFDAWRESQARPAAALIDPVARIGRDIFMERCAGCHTIRGTEAKGVFGPDLTHLGSRRQIAAGMLTNTTQNVLDWVRQAQQIKPGSQMPSFTLNDQDAQALSIYLAALD